MIIFSSENQSKDFSSCGGKAYKLKLMIELGINVPAFFCITEGTTDDEIITAVKKYFPENTLFSVRSSASSEDGENNSFAGQFDTFLNVHAEDVPNMVRRCFSSACSETIKAYTKNKEQTDFKMNVIVQKMVTADFSGILFTRNPLGILSESVIIVGNGSGNNVVEDRVDTTSYYSSYIDNKEYFVRQRNSPLLKKTLRDELISVGTKLEKSFGKGLDIEFTVYDKKLYFLQARPITTINRKSSQIVLDNSNISESYPGITLPLTESFIKTVYSEIFICLVNRLCGTQYITKNNPEIFTSMVESYNGRIFYNINSWYFVLKLLPFSKKIIPVWQEMLGVSESSELPDFEKTSLILKLRITFNFIFLFLSTPHKMNKLRKYFDTVDKEFTDNYKSDLPYDELYAMYEKLRSGILHKWDITLANDMYTFIMTALFRKSLHKKGLSESECNAEISGIQNVESMKPIRSIMELAVHYKTYGENTEYKSLFNRYIEKYGDRSIGELKLETETFRECPELLLTQIKTFASTKDIEKQLIKISEESKNGRSFLAAKTILGIANREFSRMNRSRLYGFARKIFLDMGRVLYNEGKIYDIKDVFYLTTKELKNGIITGDFKDLINERKQLYSTYETLPAYKRVIFADKIVNKPICPTSIETQSAKSDFLVGTPCSSGKVKGSIIVVNEANYSIDTTGKIIVTRSTDPGWVFLLACSKGIIAEKGSLLSHTAIISRELKIPSIVGVENVTEILKTGDLVEMDCNTGIIKRL